MSLVNTVISRGYQEGEGEEEEEEEGEVEEKEEEEKKERKKKKHVLPHDENFRTYCLGSIQTHHGAVLTIAIMVYVTSPVAIHQLTQRS